MLSPAVYSFDRWFHLLVDLVWLALNLYMVGAVRGKPTQSLHMRWIVPSLASDVVSLIYRLMTNAHYVFHYPFTAQDRLAQVILGDTESIVGLYAIANLLVALRKLALMPSGNWNPYSQQEETVWPPAPTGLRE